MKNGIIKFIALLLVFATLSGMAGCAADPRNSSTPVEDSVSDSVPADTTPDSLPETDSAADSTPALDSGADTDSFNESVSESTTAPAVTVKTIAEAKSKNADVVGWLKVPNTTIDEPVVCYTKDVNKYYLRRNWVGQSDYNGCYFGDYRGIYGARANLSNNTVIYGHSMDDNSNGGRFSQLKKFRDISFAQKNPCITFSTSDGETYTWQIFAAFITTTNISYNNPTITGNQTMKLANACKKKSLYTYNVDVTAKDKILTLSTCIYEVGGKKMSYPNDYRFVVMAKLLPAGSTAPTSVSLTANPKATK